MRPRKAIFSSWNGTKLTTPGLFLAFEDVSDEVRLPAPSQHQSPQSCGDTRKHAWVLCPAMEAGEALSIQEAADRFLSEVSLQFWPKQQAPRENSRLAHGHMHGDLPCPLSLGHLTPGTDASALDLEQVICFSWTALCLPTPSSPIIPPFHSRLYLNQVLFLPDTWLSVRMATARIQAWSVTYLNC